MAIPKERIEAIFYRFAIVFPLPTEAEPGQVIDVWINVLSRYTEKQIDRAANKLIETMLRFPYPADFVQAIKEDPLSGAI